MRLSVNSNIFGESPGGSYSKTIDKLKLFKDIGFSVLDLNFCSMRRGKGEFLGDNWEQEAYNLRNAAEKEGITFSQSHPPFHPLPAPIDPSDKPGFMEQFNEWVRRSIIVSGICGVKWAVMHPYMTYPNDMYDINEDVKLNHTVFDPLLELAKKYGVGIALENIVGFKAPLRRRFSATAEELTLLIDSFHDESVGACWDFGHGNRMYKDQKAPLRKIGPRLKATHVNDNLGTLDSHMPPFLSGNVNWHEIMPILTEIGYQNDFTFELHETSADLPDELTCEYLRLAVEAGSYCLSLR